MTKGPPYHSKFSRLLLLIILLDSPVNTRAFGGSLWTMPAPHWRCIQNARESQMPIENHLRSSVLYRFSADLIRTFMFLPLLPSLFS